ncbi:pyrimidine/purine nucleoside phosphorylase [Intestinirhabdus alba]|jgi:uncharacterized protein YaiE (UPF0345 family)|uniref:Pyrimidine/purine nucleoside phosphorylase n=1 Tax=Intestinirhabdus alba TaxID=2899544 RepID=A0A6L6IKJ3_9ENTR|nr:pyrimidine/purine nucleoside phosphorylase [Intestinirhabdus alba]MTH46228.1 pyrimidine/purine nucleoside phosphorylase [Intestinirhabdus alba]
MLQNNEYFSGKVKSIGFSSSDTGRASVGVMVAGEYRFTTAEPEEMTVVSGALKVLLPDAVEWRVFGTGETFRVPGHSEFYMQAAEPASWLCRYL